MIIKKFLLFFITLTFTLVNPVGVLAATLSLSPTTGTYNKGCTFSLNIILDSGSDQVEGADVNYLLYDSSKFTATSIEAGTIFSDYPISNIDTQTGKIYISGVDGNNKPFNGQGTFATVNFTVKDSAPLGLSQMSLYFTQRGDTTDSNVEVVQNNTVLDVLSSVTNGSYTVGSGSCGAQASIAATSPGKGGITTSTGSVTTTTLPLAGSEQLTATLAIIGGILTILGILGLVLL